MRIKRDHDLGIVEAKSRMKEVARDLEQRLSLTSEWRGDTLLFKGSGATGEIAVAESNIEFNIQLGLALMLMEGQIRSAIDSALDKHL